MAENRPKDVPKSVFKVLELNVVFSTNIKIHIPGILSNVQKPRYD